MANLVAKRCGVLRHPEDRALVWFIQWRSHRDGGLDQLAADLKAMFPDRVGSAALRRMKLKRGQSCSPDQVRELRGEAFRGRHGLEKFPLRGEETSSDSLPPERRDWRDAKPEYPETYRADDFMDLWEGRLEQLPRMIGKLCLDPAIDPGSYRPECFPDLVRSLREYRAAWIKEQASGFVETAVSQRVFSVLDYTLHAQGLTLAVGQPRTGKTFAAKAWCERHPGLARYVQVPSTADEMTFNRAIAAALGQADSLSMTNVQLRTRIEYTLQTAKLLLVLDEGHFVWPQANRREALPNRLNWILNALVNHGVPVMILATPQFYHDQRVCERKTGWSSAQLLGRIKHHEELPERLGAADLLAISRAMLPGLPERVMQALAGYAQTSARHVASIEAIASRARFLAAQAGRDRVTQEDVRQAMQGSVIPSDNKLCEALTAPAKGRRHGLRNPVAQPLQERFEVPEDRLHGGLRDRGIQPARSLVTLNEPRLETAEAAAELVTG